MLFGTPFIMKYIIPISLGGSLYGDEFISTVWVTKKNTNSQTKAIHLGCLKIFGK